MLLSVRQNFPQPGKKLDPGLLCQCGGDVAQLDEGAEQGPGLQTEKRSVSQTLSVLNLQPAAASHTPMLRRFCRPTAPRPNSSQSEQCHVTVKTASEHSDQPIWPPQPSTDMGEGSSVTRLHFLTLRAFPNMLTLTVHEWYTGAIEQRPLKI